MPPFEDRRNRADLPAADAAGRSAEFADFYAKHRKFAHAYVNRKVQNAADASDVVNEAWMSMYKQWQRQGRPVKPEAYFTKVMQRAIADYFRKMQAFERFVDLTEIEAKDERQEDQFTAVDTRALVSEALTALPTQQRQVMSLHLAGYRGAEIANALSMSVKTVSVHLSRARRTLKDLLRFWL